MKTVYIHIKGASGAGKTVALEAIVPALKSAGFETISLTEDGVTHVVGPPESERHAKISVELA